MSDTLAAFIRELDRRKVAEEKAARKKKQDFADQTTAWIDAPPVTHADIVRGTGGWKDAVLLAKDRAAKAAYDRAHADDLVATPEPEF